MIIPVQNKTLRKKCPYLELFWSTFSAFGLNIEKYGVSLRIQPECGKMRARITPNTNTFHEVRGNAISPVHCFIKTIHHQQQQWQKWRDSELFHDRGLYSML